MKTPALIPRLGSLLVSERAATATEYAVMLALVLVVIIATVTTLGQNLSREYTVIDSTLFGS